MSDTYQFECRCGAVALEAAGDPSMSNECLCDSCRSAAGIFSALDGGLNLADPKGATHVLIYRTDKISCLRGAGHLKEHRLEPESGTRRIVATCCNTPLFLDVVQGPWLSLYAINWPGEHVPPVQYRTFCNDLEDPGVLPADVPNGKPVPLGVVRRFLSMTIALKFRIPKVTFVSGVLDL